jgi:hypothetical protein
MCPGIRSDAHPHTIKRIVKRMLENEAEH